MIQSLGTQGIQIPQPNVSPRLSYAGKQDVPEAVNTIMTEIINLPVYQYVVLMRELDAYLDEGFDE